MARKRKKTDAVQAAHEAAESLEKGLQGIKQPQEPARDETIETAAAGIGELIEQQKAAQDEALKMTGEELQRLMNLPLMEIEKLPQEKREKVWDELARQMAQDESWQKIAEQIESRAESAVKALTPVIKSWEENAQRIRAAAAAITEPIKNIGTLTDMLQETLSKMISADTLRAAQTLTQLAPYLSAEMKENPDKYTAQQHGIPDELIAVAARRAREAGENIPHLLAEDNAAQQIEMQLDFSAETAAEQTRRQHLQEAHERRELAQAAGAITESDGKIATIAEKGLGFGYFTSTAIKTLPGLEEFILDEDGRINLYNLEQQGRELREPDELHTGFLGWLLKLAYNNSDLRETNSTNAIMPVYLPAVLKEMQIDPRPRQWDKETKTLKKRQLADGQTLATLRRDKFMEFLQPLSNMAGFYGDDLYRIATLHSYNAESETAYIVAPYMFKLVEYAKLHADKHGAIKTIFHADIMTENQTAVEVANRIAMGVLLRGVTRAQADTYNTQNPRKPSKVTTKTKAPDGTEQTVTQFFAPDPEPPVITPQPRIFKFEARFSSLIKDCPQLQRELDEIRNSTLKDKSQRINKKLKDTFDAAIRIILEKSDMPHYYKDFHVKSGKLPKFRPPTNSTLSEKLIITHKGKNPDYSD